jgi:chromosome segregation ATPase
MKLKLHESNSEIGMLTKVLTDKLHFMNATYALDRLFQEGQMNNTTLMDSVKNKTQALEMLRQSVEEKHQTVDGLNSTLKKLKAVQEEYRGILRELDENVNYMKSKKIILKENIIEKQKVKKLYKKTIDEKLKILDEKLKQYDPDNLTIESFRNEKKLIGDRIKMLINKENSLFNSNKLKY